MRNNNVGSNNNNNNVVLVEEEVQAEHRLKNAEHKISGLLEELEELKFFQELESEKPAPTTPRTPRTTTTTALPPPPPPKTPSSQRGGGGGMLEFQSPFGLLLRPKGDYCHHLPPTKTTTVVVVVVDAATHHHHPINPCRHAPLQNWIATRWNWNVKRWYEKCKSSSKNEIPKPP